MGQPRPLLSFIFGLFKQTSLQFLPQIKVKNVHPVYGPRIRTHDLHNHLTRAPALHLHARVTVCPTLPFLQSPFFSFSFSSSSPAVVRIELSFQRNVESNETN